MSEGGGALRVLFASLGFDIDRDALAEADSLVKRLGNAIKGLIPAASKAGAAAGAVGAQAKQSAEDAKKPVAALAELEKKAAKERADHAAQKTFDASAAGQEHAAWKRLAEAEKEAQKPITGLGDLVSAFHARAAPLIGQRLPQSFQKLAQSMGVAKGDFAVMGKMALGGLALLGALAVGAVASSVALAETSEQLRETARESRVTSQELQEFQHAGAQSGVGAERMAAGVAHLGQSLRSAEMRMGGGGVGGTLRRLGVQMRDSSGRVRDTGEVMDDLALAFERVHSPIQRARLATQLFGESGRRMLDVLHTGPGGLRALRDEMEMLGGGITPEATEASRQFTMAQERLARGSDSLRSVLATGILPVLTGVASKAAELAGLWARLTRGTHVVEIGMVALGATAAAVALGTIGVWGPVVLPFVFLAAKVALVVAVFDDLWGFIEGNDSALGRFIDSMTHVGASAEFARAIREEWQLAVEWVERLIGKIDELTGSHLRGQAAIGTLRAPRVDGRPNTTRARDGKTRENPMGPTVTTEAPLWSQPAGPLRGAGREVQPWERRSIEAPTVAPPWAMVPATRAVPVAGGRGARVVQHHRTTTIAEGAIVIHNATDPEAVGRIVRRELAAANATQADADHATDDDDTPVGAGGVNEL